MERHPIESLMGTSMENIKDMVDVNTVVGDPVMAQDGSTIIPISRVSFRLCCGRRGVCARGRTDGCLRIAVCRRSRRGHFDSPHGVSGLLGKRGQAVERELRVADGADGRDDSAGFGGA